MPELTLITYSFLLQTKMWVNYQHPPLFCFHYLAIVDVGYGLAGERCNPGP